MTALRIEEAIAVLIKAAVREEGKEKLNADEALGCILAEDITAPLDQPPFHRSPLDGYALRAGDIGNANADHPIELLVTDKIMAGTTPYKTVGRGETIRLMTGAPIPDGADCVIRQEDTDMGEKRVKIFTSLKPYENFCFRGEDFHKGQCLLKKGAYIRAAEAAILASCGKTEVMVYKRPAVSVFSTGDEIVSPGEPLKAGKIYDSNLYYLKARLRELGLPAKRARAVADDAKTMAEEIKKAAEDSSLIITTGGVSVGEKDIMHEVAELLGAERLFWRVRIKPGSPTLAWRYKDTLVISLTGNPFGVIVNFEILARPVLEKMSRGVVRSCQRGEGVLEDAFKKASPSGRIIRAKYEKGKVYLPKGRASGMLSSMSKADCFADIPPGADELKRGDKVDVIFF